MYAIPNELKISLTAARINAKMTRAEAAKQMNVGERTIESWERGLSSPTILQAEKLYVLYRRPVDSIIF